MLIIVGTDSKSMILEEYWHNFMKGKVFVDTELNEISNTPHVSIRAIV